MNKSYFLCFPDSMVRAILTIVRLACDAWDEVTRTLRGLPQRVGLPVCTTVTVSTYDRSHFHAVTPLFFSVNSFSQSHLPSQLSIAGSPNGLALLAVDVRRGCLPLFSSLWPVDERIVSCESAVDLTSAILGQGPDKPSWNAGSTVCEVVMLCSDRRSVDATHALKRVWRGSSPPTVGDVVKTAVHCGLMRPRDVALVSCVRVMGFDTDSGALFESKYPASSPDAPIDPR